MTHEHVIAFTDGGARGNPGPGGAGAVICALDRTTELATISEYIGDEITNNQAEYQAVILALTKAHELGATLVDCFLDSELIVNQLKLEYKVKNQGLQPYFVKAWNLIQQFKTVTFTHVPREKNKRADQLVNQALDRHL
ncbi:MAG: ribonuclease HI family protein [Patescibacteria group bacterium]|jgi:ribonuclease HI